MLYVSQLEGEQVWDAWGVPVGRCTDVLVCGPDHTFPPVCALALRDDGLRAAGLRFVAADQVSVLHPNIVLTVCREQIRPYTPHGDELWLIDRVLDRQIVDTAGRRLVFVSDLQVARVRDRFCLTSADVGGLGLLRRLGLEEPVTELLRLYQCPLPQDVIPWVDVAPLQQWVSRDRMSKLSPADIAAMFNSLETRRP